MLDRLQKFFSESIAPAEADDDAHRLRVAACALLQESAQADDEFSDAERATIAGIVGQRFQRNDTETAELLALAEEERGAAGGLYQFARLINDSFTRARKLAIVELLWRVVYSDGVLEAHEDALMHRMGKMLGIRHEELMALKLKVKKQG